MKYILNALLLTLSLPAFSQDTIPLPVDTMPKYWKLKAIYTLNGTQSTFVNWSAGGRNNISVLGTITSNANYEKKNFKWSNDLNIALGGLQYIDKGATEGLQKTDDKFDITTNVGHRIKEKHFISFIAGLKTQMLDGFAFPNDSVPVSRFMSPGYVSAAIGIDFVPNDHFSLFSSPVAMKMTIVNDLYLRNAGAFGVSAATYDGLGNLLAEGKKTRSEFGAYVKIKYNKEIVKNVEMKGKLELFSNYTNNPQNIDVNAEVLFNFKVNSWLSASLQWALIYDDDVDVRDGEGNMGPRTQFKSVIGLGVTYKMANFKEK